MLTMTDLFCGAGGSTTGASMVPGLTVAAAVNHWPTAVRTHEANHGDVEHKIADISQLSPANLPWTDILWASPECRFHSQAQVRRLSDDEAAVRSRATAWDVLRFAEHGVEAGRVYRALIVENVAEFSSWRFFGDWCRMLSSLGYAHRLVHLNSAVANVHGSPAPQYRDRMYVVAWHESEAAPDFTALSPKATCANCGPVRGRQKYWKPQESWSYRGVAGVNPGKYRHQYGFTCPECGGAADPHVVSAEHALDVTDPGASVTRRSRQLADKTLRRVLAGISKTRVTAAEGDRVRFVMRNNGSRGNGGEHCTPVSEPFRTLTTAGHQSVVTYTARATDRASLRTARTRFLKPHEVARAMGFPDDYVLLGSPEEQRRMLGNAVTPPAARELLTMVTASLTGAAAA